jgi:hypothetical protein
MRWNGFTILATAVLMGSCGHSTGLDDGKPPEAADFVWSGQVPLGATVEIKNINGDVHARRGSDGMVRVRAVRRGKSDDPSSVRIKVLEGTQGVTICAVYPDVQGQPPNQCRPGLDGRLSSRDNDVTVTFDIAVPAGRAFFGGTVAGSVEASGLAGYVQARTLAGDIDISTSGMADAATGNGKITASIGQVGWDRDLSFSALSGAVIVRVPRATNAVVRGSTSGGSISTDFPLNITRVGGLRIMRGQLGSGGRNLTITTGSGDIALLSNQGQTTASTAGMH